MTVTGILEYRHDQENPSRQLASLLIRRISLSAVRGWSWLAKLLTILIPLRGGSLIVTTITHWPRLWGGVVLCPPGGVTHCFVNRGNAYVVVVVVVVIGELVV